MELYVFDRELNFQGILESFFSLRWVRKYSKCGEFELHCGLTADALNLLKKGNIIWKKDDLEAGYIEYRNLSQDSEGNETLIVKGKFATGYLNRRIVWGTENLSMAAEAAIRQLIDKNCINPSDPERIIPLLQLGDLKGYIQSVAYQTSYSNLFDEIESIAAMSGLGFRTMIDVQDKRLIFDVYEGADRTVSQSENPPCIFSKEFENILEQEFTDSQNNYRSLALVGGEGEGADRDLVTVGSGTGLDRYEMFVDARDLQRTIHQDGEEVTIPIEDYGSMLKDRGNSKLSERKEIQTFDSKINLNSNLVYKTDFDLGDIVTCTSKKWGVTVDTRIVEIEEVYEESGSTVNVVFGNEIPTLIEKIRQAVR